MQTVLTVLAIVSPVILLAWLGVGLGKAAKIGDRQLGIIDECQS